MGGKPETPQGEALLLAKTLIRKLPDGCGYALCLSNDCDRANPAELEIFPRDNRDYYHLAADLRLQPEVPEEIQYQHGILRIVIYVPGAWESNETDN